MNPITVSFLLSTSMSSDRSDDLLTASDGIDDLISRILHCQVESRLIMQCSNGEKNVTPNENMEKNPYTADRKNQVCH